MTEYRRFVSYIYAYRNGKKEKNTGFAKVEARGKNLKISIQLEAAGNRQAGLDAYAFLRKEERLFGIFLGELQKSGSSKPRQLHFLKVETDPENLMGSGYALKGFAGLWIKGETGENYITVWDDEPVRRMDLEVEGIEIGVEKSQKKEPQIIPENSIKKNQERSLKKEPEMIQGKTSEAKNEETQEEISGIATKTALEAEEKTDQKETPESDEKTVSEKHLNGVRAQEAEMIAGENVENLTENEPEIMVESTAKNDETKQRLLREPEEQEKPEAWIKQKMEFQKKPNQQSAPETELLGEPRQPAEPKEKSAPEPQEEPKQIPDPELQEASKQDPDPEPQEESKQAPEPVNQDAPNQQKAPGFERKKQSFYQALWNQLAPERAHRNPFLSGEVEDSILISPRELPFFCTEKWSAAKNSFIYHGYYNFHHLLFGRAADGSFFLAVPGCYSVQEQRMAVSFGFPLFKENREKSKKRWQGYWCRLL